MIFLLRLNEKQPRSPSFKRSRTGSKKHHHYLCSMRYLLILALALLLASCGTPAGTNVPAAADTTAAAVVAPAAVTALEGTRWELVELNGTAVAIGAEQDTVHFLLNAADSLVNGNAGCNNFFGRYFRKGADELTFGNLGSTMMACPDMSTEQALHAALAKVDHFKLEGGSLTLLQDSTALSRWTAAK